MNRLSKRTIHIIQAAAAFAIIIALIITCGVLFSKAKQTSYKARVLDRAVIETTSIAEALKASDGDLKKAAQSMADHRVFDITENSLTLYYDEDLRPSSKTKSMYSAVILMSSGQNFFSYEITIAERASGGKIYTLTFKAL